MTTGSKVKMHVLVREASHFLRWELPEFAHHFELVDEPSQDAVLLAFGPDVLRLGANLPGLRKVAMLFPGFGINPYHDMELRAEALALIDSSYDLFFVNPGPLQVAYGSSPRMQVCDFTVDVSLVQLRSYRRRLESLVHVSSDYPQKDWPRSEQVMRSTGLRFEVFPPRDSQGRRPLKGRIARRINASRLPLQMQVSPPGYVSHREVVRRYQTYDGFVHVASDIRSKTYIDGKYTACLIEAGITGSILFWHDTFGLGNTLETVFALPVDADAAAARLLEIRSGLDVAKHSRLTREEMLDTFSPARSVRLRASRIKDLL